MEALYFIDAKVTETNAIKLRFCDIRGKVEEFIRNEYKPYFYAPHPLRDEEIKIVNYLSGNMQPIEKIDLFDGESKTFAKIFWPNPKIATRASKSFHRIWEHEIEFSKSYVFDNGLIFGALHSANNFKPILDMPQEFRGEFEETFRDVKEKDPLKYVQILNWFQLLIQPVPELSTEVYGVKEPSPEKVYSAWMLSRLTNIPVTEAIRSMHVSDWIKSMIYTYLRRNNVLIPNPEELRKGKTPHRVVGALTVSPISGIYFNTFVCDFESLYPSCIDSFNLSYETVDCTHPECVGNKISEIDHHVCMKRRGFYSILVGALKELRIRIFKPSSKDKGLPEEERKKAGIIAKLLKLLTVSSYGVTIRIHGLACPPLAEAITGYSRYALKETWRIAEERGLKPLYGDTDSIFLDNPSADQVEWLIKTVKEKFNLDLAVEKHYNLCVLPKAKKAYFGILPDGTPDIKGVTPIKSNAPPFISSVFQQCVSVLSNVRSREDYQQAQRTIKDIVRRAVENLKNRKVKLEDLVYTVKLYFDPKEKIADMKTASQQYQCALQLIDAGRKVERWNTVSFVKVKPFRYKDKIFTVKPYDFVKSIFEINVGDYMRNLLTALNQTFQPMGIKLEMEKEVEISRWLIENS